MKTSYWLAVLIFLAGVNASNAGVYKWTDANGQIHFGDKPPASSNAETVKIEQSSSSELALSDLYGTWTGVDSDGDEHKWVFNPSGDVTVHTNHKKPYREFMMYGDFKLISGRIAIDTHWMQRSEGSRANTENIRVKRRLFVAVSERTETRIKVIFEAQSVYLDREYVATANTD